MQQIHWLTLLSNLVVFGLVMLPKINALTRCLIPKKVGHRLVIELLVTESLEKHIRGSGDQWEVDQHIRNRSGSELLPDTLVFWYLRAGAN